MRTCFVVLSSLLGLATCSSGGGAPAHTCEGYGKLVRDGLRYAGNGRDLGPMVDAAVISCKEDAWSQAAIDCYTTPTSEGDPDACDALLTQEQIDKRDRRSLKALMATDKP